MGRYLAVTCAAALAMSSLGCASWFDGGKGKSTSWALQGSQKVPAASGQVTIKQENEQNRVVEVSVEHLAQPGKAFPGASDYVVWLLPTSRGGNPENLGVLQLDSDLKGHLQAHTPYRSFQVVITAEPRANVTSPSDNRVLTASVALPS